MSELDSWKKAAVVETVVLDLPESPGKRRQKDYMENQRHSDFYDKMRMGSVCSHPKIPVDMDKPPRPLEPKSY